MKKFFLTCSLLLSISNLLTAQTILLQEDFSTAFGTTPPAGWTIQTVTGDALADVWHFDNPGRRTPNSPISNPFACFDSDKLSDNGQAEVVYLISPAFDATTAADISLEFDQLFTSGFGGVCSVEVFNGTSWVSIFSNSTSTNNPQHSTFNITSHVQNKTNAQIRFKWTGNYSWYWIIDNVKVVTLPYSTEQFTAQNGITLPNAYQSSVAWGDYDNDGNLDILLTGYVSGLPLSKIYRNNGDNNFTDQNGISLTNVRFGSVAWGDYDNDGNLDILLTGGDGTNIFSKIYHNNGNSTFDEQIGISLPGVSGSSVAWGDYDNDGDLDILLTGSTTASKIYRNNGDNSFTEQIGIALTGVTLCSSAWGDYDNDEDLDILITGINAGMGGTAKIYRNNGNNTFSEQSGISLTTASFSSAAWGDYDNNGFLDILITGDGPTGIRSSKIYRNNGDNTFTLQSGISLTAVVEGNVAWGDYNNDGNLDILLTGRDPSENNISKIYKNNGDATFTEQSGISLAGIKNGSVAWGDYDNDGDLDILLSGAGPISKIYRNNNVVKNSAPNPPGSIAAYINDGKLYVSWDKSTDTETPQNGLTYNLRIGTTPGGCEVISPMALPSGKREIVTFGNAGHITQKVIKLPVPIPENIYYSVQAIDNGFLASTWSPEQSTISKFVSDFSPTSACQKNEIQFQDKSYSIDYPITSWQWKFIENGDIKAISTLQNPSYSFQTYTGTHEVELTTTNSNDETVSRTKTITVLPSPLADFTALPVCQGTLTSISNTTQPNTTIITDWLWDFGDGTPNSTAQNPVNHSYSFGTHNLSLTVNANNGCSLITTKEVLVAELPSKVLSISGNTVSCSNENTLLSAEDKNYYSYQWKTNGALITDSTKFKFYPKSSGSYSVAITNTQAANCIAESDPVSLTVKPSPPSLSISSPQETTFCLNDAASQLTAPLVSGLTYNWMVNGNLAVSGSNTYLPQQSGTYTLSVSNSDNCIQVSSNSVPNIIINPIPAVPNVTSPVPTFCSGTAFTMETPFSNDFTYQWLDNGTIVTGAVQNTFSPGVSGKYSVKTTRNGCSNTSLSTDVTILAAPVSPTIITQGSNMFCEGDSLKLSAPDVTGIKYQWKLNGGAVGTDNSIFSAKGAGTYSLTETNSSGCSANSTNNINVTVNPKPALPTVNISGPTSFCQGNSVEMSVAGTSGYTYQWENNGTGISGAQTSTYIAQSSGVYSLKISNSSGCFTRTENVTVNTLTAPSAPLISSSGSLQFCQGDSVFLSVTNTAGYKYQWKLNGGAVGTDSNQHTARAEGNYTVIVTNANGCFATSTNSVGIIVNNRPVATAISIIGTNKFCEGGKVILTVPSIAVYSYAWKDSIGPIEGEITNSYTARKSGLYHLEISNNAGCSVKTSPVKVNVAQMPLKPVIDQGNYTKGKCLGETPIKLSVEDVIEGYSYKWYKNGAPVSNLSFIEDFLEQGQYYVEASINECKSNSDSLNIYFENAPDKPVIYAKGPTVWYLTSSITNAAAYRWRYNGNLIPGSDSYMYIANQKLGKYNVSISEDKVCFTMSDAITIPTGVTGIEDADPFEGVKIYPNPTPGMFTVEMDNNIFGKLDIRIFTNEGRQILNIIFEKTTERFSTQIDLSGQSKGVYLLNMMLNKYMANRKVVVE